MDMEITKEIGILIVSNWRGSYSDWETEKKMLVTETIKKKTL